MLPSREAPGNANRAHTRPWQSQPLSDRLLSHRPKPPPAAGREDSAPAASSRGERSFGDVLGTSHAPRERPADPAQADASVHKHEAKSSSLGGGSCLRESPFAALRFSGWVFCFRFFLSSPIPLGTCFFPGHRREASYCSAILLSEPTRSPVSPGRSLCWQRRLCKTLAPRGTALAGGTSCGVKSDQRQRRHQRPAATGEGIGIVLSASPRAQLLSPKGCVTSQNCPLRKSPDSASLQSFQAFLWGNRKINSK